MRRLPMHREEQMNGSNVTTEPTSHLLAQLEKCFKVRKKNVKKYIMGSNVKDLAFPYNKRHLPFPPPRSSGVSLFYQMTPVTFHGTRDASKENVCTWGRYIPVCQSPDDQTAMTTVDDNLDVIIHISKCQKYPNACNRGGQLRKTGLFASSGNLRLENSN